MANGKATPKRLGLAALALALASGGGWWGWRRFSRAGTEALPTAVARRGELDEYVRCKGKLWVRQAAYLRAPRNAQNMRIVWLATAGKLVKPGEVVIRFDDSQLKQKVAERRAAVGRAEAELRQSRAKAQLQAQKDELALAKAGVAVERAKLEAARQAILSQIAGAEARLKLRTARAARATEAATIAWHRQSAAADTGRRREALAKAQAALGREEKVLAKAALRSPVAGFISFMTNNSASPMDPQPYRVGDQVFSGALIAEIPVLATLEMRGNLPQADRGRLRAGDAVRVHINALPDHVFHGQLLAISPLTQLVFSGQWPPPRYFRAYAALRHPDTRLRPQMSGSLEVITRRLLNAVLIPARALFIAGGRTVVYVRTRRGYRARAVRVLGRNPRHIAVTGLEAGAAVTLARPGAKPAARGAAPLAAD